MGVAEAVGAAGTIYGMIKGPKKKDVPSAFSAPTQTPQQAKMSAAAAPLIEGWMTNPPKVKPESNYAPTQATVGGTKTTYQAGTRTVNPEYATRTQAYQTARDSYNKAAAERQKQIDAMRAQIDSLNQTRGQARFAAWNRAAELQRQIDALETQNRTEQQKLSDLQAAIPQEYIQTPGQLNIADAPTIEKTYGTLNQYFQPLPDRTQQIIQATQQLPDQTRQIQRLGIAFDQTARINQATAPLADQSQAIRALGGRTNLPWALSYQGEMDPQVQSRVLAAMNGGTQVDVGISPDILQRMAQQGIDPLKQAYEDALKKASADYNRYGLRASGFELGEKYGGQDSGITSQYLKQMQNLQNNLAIQSEQQRKQDQQANIANQFAANNAAANLAQMQQANQLRRLSADRNAEQVARAADAEVIRMLQNQELQNRQLAQTGVNMLAAQDSSNRNALANSIQLLQNQQLQQNQIGQQRVNMLANQDLQNQAIRQALAQMLSAQASYDNAQLWNTYNQQLANAQYAARMNDQGYADIYNQDIALQKDNLALQQQAIQNALSFITGQNAPAQLLHSNYMAGINQANAQNLQNQQNQQAGLAGLGQLLGTLQSSGVFGGGTTPTSSSFASYLTPGGMSQAVGNFITGLKW